MTYLQLWVIRDNVKILFFILVLWQTHGSKIKCSVELICYDKPLVNVCPMRRSDRLFSNQESFSFPIYRFGNANKITPLSKCPSKNSCVRAETINRLPENESTASLITDCLVTFFSWGKKKKKSPDHYQTFACSSFSKRKCNDVLCRVSM